MIKCDIFQKSIANALRKRQQCPLGAVSQDVLSNSFQWLNNITRIFIFFTLFHIHIFQKNIKNVTKYNNITERTLINPAVFNTFFCLWVSFSAMNMYVYPKNQKLGGMVFRLQLIRPAHNEFLKIVLLQLFDCGAIIMCNSF